MSQTREDLMDLGLRGRVVFVLGGSGPVGLAIAREFVRTGARVAISYCHNAGAAETFQEECAQQSHRVMTAHLDLGSMETVNKAIDQVTKEWGSVDVLINNGMVRPALAGQRAFEEQSVSEWQMLLRSNIEGTYLAIQKVVPLMRSCQWGRIVSISSSAATDGIPGYGWYAAAKAAFHGLTRSLAKEVGGSGVLVNALSPSLIQTNRADAWDRRYLELHTRTTRLKRILQPEDVARAVVMLGSGMNTCITGEIIRLGG